MRLFTVAPLSAGLGGNPCSLLYLNPPYDTEFGPHSNKRMELVFVEHCYRWVITRECLCSLFQFPPSPRAHVCWQASLIGFPSFVLNIRSQSASIRSSCLAERKKSHLRGDPGARMSCSGSLTSRSCSLFADALSITISDPGHSSEEMRFPNDRTSPMKSVMILR